MSNETAGNRKSQKASVQPRQTLSGNAGNPSPKASVQPRQTPSGNAGNPSSKASVQPRQTPSGNVGNPSSKTSVQLRQTPPGNAGNLSSKTSVQPRQTPSGNAGNSSPKASVQPRQTSSGNAGNPSPKVSVQPRQTPSGNAGNLSSKTSVQLRQTTPGNAGNPSSKASVQPQTNLEKAITSDILEKIPDKEMEDATLGREYEEKYLAECIRVIKKNIGIYEEETQRMSAEIKDMYERYRDDDPEIFTELSNTITMNENMKLALSKNMRALKKPYFGRIDITELDGSGGLPTRSQETFYLGKGGVMKDTTHIMVVDWRAPIANVYYENGLGECSYTAPKGRTYTIDLRRKRTYELDGEKLIDFYDSEVVANDELLTKYLAKNKEAVLGEIIATIQKEQNDIIRKSPYRNMIVQGVAGSGKTTVAMHRISYILYNFDKDFKPEDFYIIGSNRILLNYITGVLPELDVHGVRQMTMEQLFIRLLYEDWDEKKYEVIPCDITEAYKGKLAWFQLLQEYCDRMEDEYILQEDIYFKDEVLFSKEQINRYRKDNAVLSIQSKIDGLNERTLVKLRNELIGRDLIYTPEERRALIKEYTGRFGAKKWKKPIFEIYNEFCAYAFSKKNDISSECYVSERQRTDENVKLQSMTQEISLDGNNIGNLSENSAQKAASYGKTGKKKRAEVQKRKCDVYDLAALAYIYKRVKETERIREAHHIVIDEAQDFGMMAYAVLYFCIPGCSWTIMGDVSQNIHFGFGLGDWEELKHLILTDPKDTFGVLSKSYRNTVEISDFAQKILQHGSFSSYPIEPIIRHGNPVCVRRYENGQDLYKASVKLLKNWQKDGLETIAVICRDAVSAANTAKELGALIKIEESDLEVAEFRQGIMVLPVDYTKGLEFDAVLIFQPTKKDYPMDNGHAKLLYVAATRALHELAVLHTGDLTELIDGDK